MELTPHQESQGLCLLPCQDLSAFYRLSERNQLRILGLLAAFRVILESATEANGLQRAAAMFTERGFSKSRLRALYYTWKKKRDWQTLIDWALEGSATRSIPQEFITYLQTRVDQNQRSIEMAIKKIRAEWHQGAEVPGYGTWKKWFSTEHPHLPMPAHCPGTPKGWHPRNLRRYCSNKIERAAATLGHEATLKHRPTVYSTRVGLYVGAHYMFDDMEHNFFVNTLAEGQNGRPLELFSHDYYSARKLRWGIRPCIEGDDGAKKKLTGSMMRLILAATLHLDGYHPRGTVLNVEHGTAAIPDWLEEILLKHTADAVTVARSGFIGRATHAGQYPGVRRGNPRFKASLESSNNVHQNAVADAPGQTGRIPSERPEGTELMRQHDALMLRVMQNLPARQAALLNLELLELNQAQNLISTAYQLIENDVDHDLEGWVECCHIIQEITLAGQKFTQDQLLALPPDESRMAIALLHAGKLETRPRKMSRLEAWLQGCGELIRIPGYTVCAILGDDMARVRNVRSNMFEFEDTELGPGTHRYEALCRTPEGHILQLADGEKYKIFANPFAPQFLFVTDGSGRYLGEAKRIEVVMRGDHAALGQAIQDAQRRENILLQEYRKRHAKDAAKHLERVRQNLEALGGTGLLDAEPTRAGQKIEAIQTHTTNLQKYQDVKPNYD